MSEDLQKTKRKQPSLTKAIRQAELDRTETTELRDWFAGQAMVSASKIMDLSGDDYATWLALCCYEIADAMLEARRQ
jgi:uncharacterized protein YcsI (UPF0317 family)